MMKRILISILSLSLACPAWALRPVQTQTVHDFLKESKVGSRSVSFKDFYNKARRYQSLDVQREFDLYLKQYPDMKMPQAKVTKLQEGKVEIVQIEFVQGKDRMTLQIRGQSDFAKMTLVRDGKKIERRIGRFEMRNPIKFMAGFGSKTPWTRQVPSVQLLSQDQIKHLGPQEKQRYIDRVRAMMAAAEKVQASLNPAKKTSGILWQMFEAEAYADAATGDCIVAGWVGSYQSNSCKPPAEAIGSSCIKCNTDIYGSNAPCLGNGSGKLPLNATEICNTKTEETKYAVFQGVKSAKDVEDRMTSLSGVLTGLRDKCASIQEGGTALADQSSTCAVLGTRLDDLELANCEVLEAHPDFADLKCQPVIAEPEPEPIPEEPIPEPNPAPKPVRTATSAECEGLPDSYASLECNGTRVRSLDCDVDGGTVERFYCVCGRDEDGEKDNTVLDIACVPKKAAVDTSKDDEKEKKKKKKYKEPFIQPWMIGLGVGAAVLLMGYYQQKTALESYYAIPPAMPLGLPPLSSPTYLPSTR